MTVKKLVLPPELVAVGAVAGVEPIVHTKKFGLTVGRKAAPVSKTGHDKKVPMQARGTKKFPPSLEELLAAAEVYDEL